MCDLEGERCGSESHRGAAAVGGRESVSVGKKILSVAHVWSVTGFFCGGRFEAVHTKLRDSLDSFVRETQGPSHAADEMMHDLNKLVHDSGHDARTMPEYPSRIISFDGMQVN